VTVEGSTVFRTSDFERLYAPLIGKEVSLADIYNLRDAITARYRSAGYILSQAIIPPQQIADGSVRLQVIEGYVSSVEIRGEVNDRRGLIREMAQKITRSRPTRLADMERYVLLIGDLPGVDVKTVLEPSKDQSGASNLIVLLARKPLGIQAEADNRGSRAIGPDEFSAGIALNSLLGLDEQTTLQGATVAPVRELHYLSIHHDETLNSEGLRLNLSASTSEARPEGLIAPLDALGRDQIYSVGLSEAVIRSRASTLTLGANFTVTDATTDLLNTLFSRDHLRVVSANGSYDFADTWFGDTRPATSLLTVQVSHGLDVLGATGPGSADLSRVNGRSDFTKATFLTNRVQSITSQFSLFFAAEGQATGDALLTTEQFGLGGASFGRGYEPSELTGDQGLAASLEARYSPSILPRYAPQFYAFYDVGIIWLNAPLAGERSGASLASTGIGLRFALTRYLTADLDLAKPLTRVIASRGNKDVLPLFTISTSF
jgi:hemolysin activation/secretion protein